MTGGVNLIESLPPPINGLAGLGVTGGQLVYDPTTRSVASVTIEVLSDPQTDWQLLPKLKVDALWLILTVKNPVA